MTSTMMTMITIVPMPMYMAWFPPLVPANGAG